MTLRSQAESENGRSGLVFVADLGGTHLRAGTVNYQGQVHYRLKVSTPKAEKPDEIVWALISAARECQEKASAQGKLISAVAVAVPGTVDVQQGVVIKAPNVPSLDGFRLGPALEAELGWPARLENDANAAAVGELWRGAGRDHETIICLTLGTGVGGGIILEGELWRGADGSAGEIGHMGVDPFAGVPCGCGSRGCLEVYASATAIVRMTREEIPNYPQSSLRVVENLTAESIYEAGTRGDELALEVFQRMGVYLGIGIANLVNLINPELIVVGGGVANGWQLFEQQMHQQVLERAFPLPARSVKIVRAQCGDDAGLLGAARLAFNG